MIAAIDALLERWTQPGSPGCAIGVARDGEILYAKGYGLAHVELGVPNGPETVFRIASITKHFTCLAILMLAREGKLSLDDDVRRFVPALPEYGRPILVRHLMTNTSGLRDSLEAFRLTGITLGQQRSVAEMVEIICRQRGLNFLPGDSYLYSNAGFVLLTVIAEQLAGMSLRDFLDARIFGKLGMGSTALLPFDAEPFPGRAQGYAPDQGRLWRVGSGFETNGEGGMVSSVDDLLAWMACWGTGRLDGIDPLAILDAPPVLTSGAQSRYGYGFMVERYRGLKAVGHSGLLPGFTSNILHLPERGLSVVCLSNSLAVNSYLTTRLVADVVLGADFPEPAFAKPAPALLQRLTGAGLFVDEATGATASFADAEGRLGGARYGAPFLLANQDGSETRFQVVQGGFDVVSVETDGASITMTRVDGGIERYAPVAAGDTGADRLDDYVGRYRSAELASDWIIERDGDRLTCRVEGPRGPTEACVLEPTRPDLLTGRIGWFGWFGWIYRDALRFHREDGKIAGFTLNSSRTRGVRFVSVTN